MWRPPDRSPNISRTIVSRPNPPCGRFGPAAEPALIALLRNPDPVLRREACDLLGDLGGKDALLAMMTLPADPDPLVQLKARSAMQSLRNRVGPVSLPKKSSKKSSRGG